VFILLNGVHHFGVLLKAVRTPGAILTPPGAVRMPPGSVEIRILAWPSRYHQQPQVLYRYRWMVVGVKFQKAI